MKKLITAIAVSAFALIGTAVDAEARPHGGRGYKAPPASTIYVSGYRHGRPIYTEKYFVGHDRYGRPKFAYRTVSAPRRGYGNHHHAPPHRGYYDKHRSSGSRVSFHFGR